jgi:multiple sugar transport system ATP-binding protein
LPVSYRHAIGTACRAGLRPEAIVVDDAGTPCSFPVEVVAVTPLNEKTVLLLRTADGLEILASEAGDQGSTRRHGSARAGFDPAALLLFEAASGRRIAPQSA